VPHASVVDGIVPAAQRDDARPRDGEAVDAGAACLEQRDVLLRLSVRIAGDGTGTAVGDGAWLSAEDVPDGVGAAVDVLRAFDLVAAEKRLSELEPCRAAVESLKNLRCCAEAPEEVFGQGAVF
jgi:hypothetical protein